MEDTSFLYFTQDEVLDKVFIDPRLRESFKRVMKTMQEYFNANGYTKEKDYMRFLQKYLLESGLRRLKIFVAKELGYDTWIGLYNSYKCEIKIKEEMLNRSESELDATLCHEFIHFLSKHELPRFSDEEVREGGFINEALTEMLTQQMYPNSGAYAPQVEMHKFANLLSGKVNNFSQFLLKATVDARWSSPDWMTYIYKTKEFQKDFNNGCYTLSDAIKNKNYTEAQRALIDLFILHKDMNSIKDYCGFIKKLCDRVVPDDEYIEEVYSKLDEKMIKILNVQNPALVKLYKEKLKEIRNQIFKQHEMEKVTSGKKIYEIVLDGKKIIIDEKLHTYPYIPKIYISTLRNTITFELNGDKVELEKDKIKFEYREDKEGKNIKEISKIFSLESKNDSRMVESAIKQDDELIKLERFDIPNVGDSTNKEKETVYVATYSDKIVLLKNNKVVKTIDKIRNYEYLGFTSDNPEESLIWTETLGTIEDGIICSLLSDREINNRIIKSMAEGIKKSMTPEEFEKYNEIYKEEKEYYSNDSMFRNFVFKELARQKFEELPEDKKQELINKVIDDNDTVIISTKDGEVDVSLKFGVSSFRAEKSVLYNSKGEGLYNEVYDELEKSVVKNPKEKKIETVIKKDQSGNIVLPKMDIDSEIELLKKKIELQNKKIEEYQRKIEEFEKLLNNNKKNAM